MNSFQRHLLFFHTIVECIDKNAATYYSYLHHMTSQMNGGVYLLVIRSSLFYISSTSTQFIVFSYFLGTGRLIALCDDNSLHLWEINEKSLVELKAHTFEGKNKKISSLCVESTGKNLLLGTEGGNIYAIDLNAFTVNEDVIYQDVVMQK